MDPFKTLTKLISLNAAATVSFSVCVTMSSVDSRWFQEAWLNNSVSKLFLSMSDFQSALRSRSHSWLLSGTRSPEDLEGVHSSGNYLTSRAMVPGIDIIQTRPSCRPEPLDTAGQINMIENRLSSMFSEKENGLSYICRVRSVLTRHWDSGSGVIRVTRQLPGARLSRAWSERRIGVVTPGASPGPVRVRTLATATVLGASIAIIATHCHSHCPQQPSWWQPQCLTRQSRPPGFDTDILNIWHEARCNFLENETIFISVIPLSSAELCLLYVCEVGVCGARPVSLQCPLLLSIQSPQ